MLHLPTPLHPGKTVHSYFSTLLEFPLNIKASGCNTAADHTHGEQEVMGLYPTGAGLILFLFVLFLHLHLSVWVLIQERCIAFQLRAN